MSSEDVGYFRARAEQEHQAARQATQSYIAEIHLDLASAYEALVQDPEMRALRFGAI